MKSIQIPLDTLSSWKIKQRRSLVQSQFTTTRGFPVPEIPLIFTSKSQFCHCRSVTDGCPSQRSVEEKDSWDWETRPTPSWRTDPVSEIGTLPFGLGTDSFRRGINQ
ncbi:hypothetical protein CMV_019906 [Castanea mollissima]|uniref:Uncharacterized protein n=1 Tax=Castanea mollissima TaxID=60419 RepID=A0A8J4QP30_9ROSI|nr:hypothetical protein CMV_019906 [Castanea mollissima]